MFQKVNYKKSLPYYLESKFDLSLHYFTDVGPVYMAIYSVIFF